MNDGSKLTKSDEELIASTDHDHFSPIMAFHCSFDIRRRVDARLDARDCRLCSPPARPESDMRVHDTRGCWFSFGPRVELECGDCVPPVAGELTQFWSFFRWLPEENQWEWGVDVDHDEMSFTKTDEALKAIGFNFGKAVSYGENGERT